MEQKKRASLHHGKLHGKRLRHCTKINDTFIYIPFLYGRFSSLSKMERGGG
jgi:hypothetical protein